MNTLYSELVQLMAGMEQGIYSEEEFRDLVFQLAVKYMN